MKNKDELLDAMIKEIILRKDYLKDEPIETIYFGGGTPSLLSYLEIENILNSIYSHYNISGNNIEITLEANPNDLSPEKLNELKSAGINRLSIGIQSFKEHDLKWLNRAHSKTQSLQCIEDAQNVGFENITIDLIYGIPGQTDMEWTDNMNMLASFNLPHFSAYALTVEAKTALYNNIEKGKTTNVDEDQTARHFQLLQDWSEQNNYLAYEISNYCKPGKFSRHNSSYWQGKKYIGIGPSAHSFDLVSRQWNIANNALYIKNLNENKNFFEKEVLSIYQRYNEYIMTSLRTIWGCSRTYILDNYGLGILKSFDDATSNYVNENLLFINDNTIFLSMAGKLLADKISSDLFII